MRCSDVLLDYRSELPRIYELADLLPDSARPDAYFRDLDERLTENPHRLQFHRELERELAGLDSVAWSFLKSEVQPLLEVKYPQRGWEPLFDRLNQAKAYNYLKRGAYEGVKFIPTSSRPGRKTPDLEASKSGRRVLCEVKTVNPSEVEVHRRASGGVGIVSDRLEPGFFRKLTSDLAEAKVQMTAFDARPDVRKLVYVIINFDDHSHEYADRYHRQIDGYFAEHPSVDLELISDWKAPFATAWVKTHFSGRDEKNHPQSDHG
jgi:hypothetical protein